MSLNEKLTTEFSSKASASENYESNGNEDGRPPKSSAYTGNAVNSTYAVDPQDLRFYKPIASYEGLHRWDPYFEWTPKEEKQLVRKVLVN